MVYGCINYKVYIIHIYSICLCIIHIEKLNYKFSLEITVVIGGNDDKKEYKILDTYYIYIRILFVCNIVQVLVSYIFIYIYSFFLFF